MPPTARRLTLLRHAKAQVGETGMQDRDRPLNERGERDAPMMGRRLRDRGARPSLILTSPSVRTMQTATLVAREIGYPREFLQREADLYLASPETILDVVARQDDSFHDILVCGHNPGITDLANGLSGSGLDNIPTCGLVVIEARVKHWRNLRDGKLLLFDYPKRPAGETAAG